MEDTRKPAAPRGRAAATNPDSRYAAWTREASDDGWNSAEQDEPALPTQLIIDRAKSVIAYNDSPDVPFTHSINPYRGCEHGCAYCFARPSHAYLGLSPGLDFETRIAYKPDAPECLRAELAAPSYRCAPIALGINTDGWQPIERKLELTRRLLEVLHECAHPVSIVTKAALITRDLDLLADMGRRNLVQVMFSVTTLDGDLARRMEPRAAQPQRRLAAMRELAAAGVPVGVLFAPLIPALNEHEMEAVLAAARDAGATNAGYVLLRLPREVGPLFKDWLQRMEPGKAEHVMSRMRQMHGGKEYDSNFGQRMRGSGPFADLLAQRFRLAATRLGLDRRLAALDLTQFRPPRAATGQMELF
ncbi:MAG: PA0069 family radical SAM protein [Rhodocyclaceae bacterium]|nr:PA0069 family radical SAM protein [Rhodocyclaceae bacterium]MBX3666784.1 PA0069 family radical SAM protein [Rhodocyclaceae bacterium]